jgi:hypothetical protein
LLISILNLTMLAKGFLPMHASAFTYKNTGVVATGWAKGGKTETLFAFMANGAASILARMVNICMGFLSPSEYGIGISLTYRSTEHRLIAVIGLSWKRSTSSSIQ